MASMTGEHLPARPSWACRACDVDWPCAPARETLAQEHAANPAALGLYMAMQLADAAGELYLTPTEVLYERFIAWPLALRLPLDAS